MVFCDGCGIKTDPHDKYCRICGRTTNPPTLSWRIKTTLGKRAEPVPWVNPSGQGKPDFFEILAASPKGGVEQEHRRFSHKSIEYKSAIDTPPIAPLMPGIVKSGTAMTQVDQLEVQREKKPKHDQAPEELLFQMREFQNQNIGRSRGVASTILSYVLVGIGGVSLLVAVVLTSTVLAFVGLGLVFWGGILLFIRPGKYVRSDLMDSTAMSSLKTIDRVMLDLGYTEKGVYLPAGNPEKAVIFVPAGPLTRIPKAHEIENQTFTKNPKGIVMIPPGLTLANLIERGLGGNLRKHSLETLRDRLPKLLVEDLEIVQNFEMRIDGNDVRFRFVESIYRDFCNQLRATTKVSCSLGCPICSAMACVLTMATGKPVSFEGDEYTPDGRTLEAAYRILEA